MVYTYFVSYSHEQGHGCVEITKNEKIKTFDDVKSINELIEKKYGLKQVVVNNFILLNKKKKKKWG